LDSLSIDQREAVWIGIIQEAHLPSSGIFVIEDDDKVLVGLPISRQARDADSTPHLSALRLSA